MGSRAGIWLVAAALLAAALMASPALAAAETRPTAVIAYYASDDGEPEAELIEKTAAVMFNSGGPPKYAFTVEEYFLTETFGKVDFSGSIADVFGPYHLATPKANCPFNAWNSEAEQLATSEDGFERSRYAQIVYLYENAPFEPSDCASAGAGGGEFAWINGLSGYTIAHELGHVLGAPHAAAYRCHAADGTPVPYSPNCSEVFPPGEEPSEYGDPFDPMGFGHLGSYPAEMNAWRKFGFGAIPAADAPTIATSGTYTIAPLEQGSGTRLLRISNGAGDYFDLDFRQPIGPFDQWYGTEAPAVHGVAIHVDSGGFGIEVHPSRLLDMNPQTSSFDDAPLATGQEFVDFRTPLRVQTLSVGPAGATVKISGLPEPSPAGTRRCRVPKLRLKKVATARRAAKSRHCGFKRRGRRHSKLPAGRVISQRPKAGKSVPAGTVVRVVVSSGPKPAKRAARS